ncbi:hypothetical protein F4054_13295 [Candidatus Poribacteria bacterium]|nr:hypothetical protein [Candidatus Poribacteria bacterium]
MGTNRLLFGVRGERSRFPFGQTDGGKSRSPRLPFVLVVFLTLVSSFGVAYVLATLISPPVLSPLPVSVVGISDAPARARRVPLTTPEFDAESFCRTIIENNLFRPLGWTPPRPKEPYRLIGTLLPRSAHTPPKAILQSTTGEKTYIVSVGEKIDAATEVISIESKAVTLSREGQSRTLRLRIGF